MANLEKEVEEAIQLQLEHLGWPNDGDMENEIEMELKQVRELQMEPVLDEHLHATVKELYNVAVQFMIKALDTMKDMPEYHNVNEFYRLHHVSLTLQHWEDEINRSESDKSDKWNPLSNVESAGGVFNDIAATLRHCLTKIHRTQYKLQRHLESITAGPVQLSNDPCTTIINTLNDQVNGLKLCVKPLRVLSDRNRGIGVASAIEKRSKLLRISERLPGCSNTSQFDTYHRKFFPDGVVDELIDSSKRDELVLELEAEGSEEKQALVDYIIDKEAKKLFTIALTVLEGEFLVEAMETFQDKGINDSHLPFLDREQQKLRGHTLGGKIALEDLDSFWKSRSERFNNAQWAVLAPHFSVGRLSGDLHQPAILPFIEMGAETKTGGFGEVRKIRIHEKHIDDPDGTFEELPQHYALKHVKPDKNEDDIMHFWEKEASNLQDMMKRKVKHAVRFVTAFRRASDIEATKWNHYIICEWADGGSLSDVCQRTPYPVLNSNLVREVTVQLLGLADALVEAHYPSSGSNRSFMRHGDLKPDNILSFQGEGVIGTLKIGDWGLAKQKNFATMDQVMKSSRPGATVRYISPETLTGIPIKGNIVYDKRTRLQDTWAMGCVVFELIMWMLHGLDHVNKFHKRLNISGNDGPFWAESYETLGKKTAKVAMVVTEEMDKMAKDSRCGTDAGATAIAALLDLVRTRLLVVTLPKNLGHIDFFGDEDDKKKDSDGTLRPRPTAPSRRSTILSDDETIAGSPTGSRSREDSPISMERYSDNSSHVDQNRQDDDPPQPSHDMETVPKIPHIVPEVIIDAPPDVVVDEPLEEEANEPELPAGGKDPELVAEEEDTTARARALEFRNKLMEIVQKGNDDDTGRYWFTDNVKEEERQENVRSAIPSTKPQFGTDPTPPVDSGYVSGFSGTTAVYTSGSNRKTTTTTYTSSSGTGKWKPSSRTESTGSGSLPQQTAGLLSAPKDTRHLQDYTFPILNESWTFHVDNRFASDFFSVVRDRDIVGYPDMTPVPDGTGTGTVLCKDCELLRVWEVGFSVQYPIDELRRRASTCELCNMFWESCVKHKTTGLATASFVRDHSWLKLNGSGPPVLSLLRDPYLDGPLDLQMGLPFRLDVDSPAHFELMRQWLQVCQKSHQHPTPSPETLSTLPTRLIDVGQEGDHCICLREIKDPDFEPGSYIALSHPWGDPPHFCTFRSNLASHKESINLAELPPIFRDAVITTRALGICYLWIDSICIIQGPEGDFHEEARRMEQVFSGALCVIAASSSSGQLDGWLNKAKDEARSRPFVSLQYLPAGSNTKPPSTCEDKIKHPRSIYISELIDDFASDVLQSPLNRRGWVLQERALARRTIFFTKNQTYFECGDGVRCMTLTKMKNSLAALLGDTAFPQIMMKATKGERILRYQDFYRNYSRLGLTRDYDRPIAIAGLQSRLLKAFNTKGGFGIFDEGPQPRARGHLRRSLLWYRGDDVDTLKRIDFPGSSTEHDDVGRNLEANPPSWSWMAYTGGIDYMQLEFDGIDWEGGIDTPWWPMRPEPILNKKNATHSVVLEGLARSFTFDIDGGREIELAVTPATRKSEKSADSSPGDGIDRGQIIFDIPLEAEGISGGQIKCVVLGRTSEHARGNGQRTAYILIVAPLEAKELTSYVYNHPGTSTTPDLWRRVGAGYLPESCIDGSFAPEQVYIV